MRQRQAVAEAHQARLAGAQVTPFRPAWRGLPATAMSMAIPAAKGSAMGHVNTAIPASGDHGLKEPSTT